MGEKMTYDEALLQMTDTIVRLVESIEGAINSLDARITKLELKEKNNYV